MKNIFKNNGSLDRILIVFGITLVLVVISFVLFSNNQEKNLTSKLEDMGKEFYTEFYYKQVFDSKDEDEAVEYLSRFSKI
jgi:hypothetical protein